MFGWYIILLLVLIVLGVRERKKYGRRLSELDSRLTQVEELLLELCAVVEEEKTTNEPASPPQQPVEKQDEDRGKVSSKPAAPDRTPPVSTQEEEPGAVAPPEQPPSPAPQTGTSTPQNKGQKKTRKAKVKQEKLPEWNQQIIELWQKGLSVPEIARQTGKGQGEVQLIVDLYCNERPQN